jgi:hypothetical protein
MLQWLRNRKVLISLGAAILCILLIVKLVLYINLVLGNDVGITLSASENDATLVHGTSEKIDFETRITTNPFCEATCTSRFMDLSLNSTLDSQDFMVKSGSPHRESYTITATKQGDGQELYRMSVICQSKQSVSCHTEERPVQRSILITMEYNLSEQARRQKERLSTDLPSYVASVGNLSGQIAALARSIALLDEYLILDEEKSELVQINRSATELEQRIQPLRELWQDQDYAQLSDEFRSAEHSLDETVTATHALRASIAEKARSVNEVARSIATAREPLDKTRILFIGNPNLALEINTSIKDFNLDSYHFLQRTQLKEYNASYDTLYAHALQDQNDSALINLVQADLWYKLFCRINMSCVERPPIRERLNESGHDIMASCSDIESVRELADDVTNITETWSSVINEELASLPNTRQGRLIQNRFANSTPSLPKRCRSYHVATLNGFTFKPIAIAQPVYSLLNVTFAEPHPQCCGLGSCAPCCTDEKCRSSEATIPIIFLHGHAVSEGTPFDFSIDAFQWIQTRLEADGYIDAGSIASYASQEPRSGSWGLSRQPVSIRASYYFDIYEDDEETELVQTKTENIDTYAIRLNEIINLVQQYTGKPKVRIIAHSMGGLVARRYLQVFGSDEVEQLIMIGTPNHGINGTVGRMCPVTGATLECRDMDADSLFLNKLNRGALPKADIVNIVGVGCPMDYGDGDGIVQAESAKFGRTNMIVNGSCDGGQYLHSKLLRDERVYQIIKKSLLSG